LIVLSVVLAMAATLPLAIPRRADAATSSSPGPQAGMVTDLTWGVSRGEMDRTVAMLADAGVRWVRTNVSWSGGEPTAKGSFNSGWLADIDYAVQAARAAGIEVLMPIADGVPYWASADPTKYQDGSGGHWNKYWRPTNMADYADFVRYVVNRYRVLGVHAYEVWNEPNLTQFWPSGPNASEYVSMLKPAYTAIKQADPNATVILGGLSKNDAVFLDNVYRAGAAPYFDVAAVHPYTGAVDPTRCWNDPLTGTPAKDAFCGIEAVRSVMVQHGDSASELWLTEFGWSSSTSTYGVSEAQQADFLTKAFDKLETYPYVTKAFWYTFRNSYWLRDDPASWLANTGLLRSDFTAKPALAAFTSLSGSASQPPLAPPPAPTGLTATAVSAQRIDLRWTSAATATRYVVQRSLDGARWADVATVAAPAESYANTGLTRRTKYYYRLRAENTAGASAYSVVASTMTKRR
jgi:hypothetical protein